MAQLLISMPDIAGLAGVRRPVVTTWRRRHPDFPAPVDGTLFDAGEVCAWLVGTGRARRDQIEPDLHLHTLARLTGSDAPLPAGELVAALTALVCLRHVDGEPLADGDLEDLRDRAAQVDPSDRMLWSEITAMPDELAWLAGTADDLVEAAWGCRQAFERIMAARDRLGVPDLCASAVHPELARLVAGLSGAAEHARQLPSVVLADPAAGPGDLLAAAVAAVGEQAAPVVVAAEPAESLARLVRRRLAVHGVPAADQDVSVGEDLGEDGPDPDAVVTQLPYRPQETRSAVDVLSRIDDIALSLPRGRNAVMLGPADVLAGALPRYSAAERERARLLTGGVVEAVIYLPGGLVPFRPGYQTAIWVLGPAYDSPLRGDVLLADLSDRPLSADLVDAVITDVVTWRRDGYQPDARHRGLCAQANVRRLLDTPGPLTARPDPGPRDLIDVVPATVTRVNELERALDRLADPAATSREPVRAGVARAAGGRPETTSVGALVGAGRLALIRGTRLAPGDVIAGGQHPVLGAAEVTGHARVGARTVDRAVLADRYPRAALTEPGDVVVTTAPALGAYVDHDGFSVVEFPARALRVPVSERDRVTPRVLAALLVAGGQNGRRAAGAVRPPRRLADWQVPLLDPVTAARYDQVLARIERRRRVAAEEIDSLDELDRITAAGLAGGTLTLH
ncbi:MAG TPA: hypothetical protein VFX70_11505 [Mycobacteriales bacterium]|nr:hypothetical protein [Mycobacteriales bacterium]